MIGSTINHYKILSKLGEGGMGVVYKAEDTRLKRPVALKFLPADRRNEKARFVREAQGAAALDHPNICTVYEIDEVDGRAFIAMAYLDGRSLSSVILDGPLKIEEAVEYAIRVAQSLAAAHEAGIVHRDIKSTNIMVTSAKAGVQCRSSWNASSTSAWRKTQSNDTRRLVIFYPICECCNAACFVQRTSVGRICARRTSSQRNSVRRTSDGQTSALHASLRRV